MEGLEYLLDDPLMVHERGGVNEYVIHITDGFVAVDGGAEDVIHHGLKVVGELHSPKNMMSGSKSPQFVEKAAFHLSPSLRWTLLKPQQRSRVVNHSALRNLVSTLETNGSG